jgi:hypothetical protein
VVKGVNPVAVVFKKLRIKMYKVTYRTPEVAENVVEFLKFRDETEAHDYFSLDDEIEIIEVIEATHDEIVAYEAGLKQGWEDHNDYMLIEERMKKHNGHVFELIDVNSFETVELFICGKCQKSCSVDQISGEQTPVGTYETLWDVCLGCAK